MTLQKGQVIAYSRSMPIREIPATVKIPTSTVIDIIEIIMENMIMVWTTKLSSSRQDRVLSVCDKWFTAPIVKNMWVAERGVTMKSSMPVACFLQHKKQFLQVSIDMEDIPSELICNWDDTGINLVVTLLKELGVRVVIYIDNISVLAELERLATERTRALIALTEALGFIVHKVKKIKQPTLEIEFLGMKILSLTQELQLPGEKIKLRAELKLLNSVTTPTIREVSRLLGKMNVVSRS